MCRSASFVLTKDKVFWSKNGDSHEDIIKEFSLHDDGARGPNILRVEIVPDGKRYDLPLSDWKFKLDQDTIPEWFNMGADEDRARLALNDWTKAHIIREGHATVEDWQTRIFLGTSQGTVNGGEGRFFGSSTGTVNGGKCWFRDSSTGTVNGGEGVFYDSSTGTVNGGWGRFYDCSKKKGTKKGTWWRKLMARFTK